MRPVPEDDSDSDEIKREDGLERFWMFTTANGQKPSSAWLPAYRSSSGAFFIFWGTRYLLLATSCWSSPGQDLLAGASFLGPFRNINALDGKKAWADLLAVSGARPTLPFFSGYLFL
jgi:hypothetical protein